MGAKYSHGVWEWFAHIFERSFFSDLWSHFQLFGGWPPATRGTPRRPTPEPELHISQNEYLYDIVTVEITNVKKSEPYPPAAEGGYITIPVGDMIGHLTKYDRKHSTLKPHHFQKCCGANGRIQLHLATKPGFSDVTKLVKKKVKGYLGYMRKGDDPHCCLRLTSCGCIPVSHIFWFGLRQNGYGNHT